MNKQLAALRKKTGIPTLEFTKQAAMQRAVVATKGDVILAAALLGIGKTSLYRHLNKYGWPKGLQK